MTAPTWLADVDRILEWTSGDDRFLDRVQSKLGAERRDALAAVIQSGGDMRELAQSLGPLAIAKLRALRVRVPDGMREPAARAWSVLQTPLEIAWSPPAEMSADQIAAAFLERYTAGLDELTGRVTAAAAQARAFAGAMKSIAGSKELVDAAATLQTQIGELTTTASTCAHPETDRAGWTGHAKELLRESVETVEAVRAIRARATELSEQAEALARALTEWADAPPRERASQAEGMAARLRAATGAVASMHEQFLAAVFQR